MLNLVSGNSGNKKALEAFPAPQHEVDPHRAYPVAKFAPSPSDNTPEKEEAPSGIGRLIKEIPRILFLTTRYGIRKIFKSENQVMHRNEHVSGDLGRKIRRSDAEKSFGNLKMVKEARGLSQSLKNLRHPVSAKLERLTWEFEEGFDAWMKDVVSEFWDDVVETSTANIGRRLRRAIMGSVPETNKNYPHHMPYLMNIAQERPMENTLGRKISGARERYKWQDPSGGTHYAIEKRDHVFPPKLVMLLSKIIETCNEGFTKGPQNTQLLRVADKARTVKGYFQEGRKKPIELTLEMANHLKKRNEIEVEIESARPIYSAENISEKDILDRFMDLKMIKRMQSVTKSVEEATPTADRKEVLKALKKALTEYWKVFGTKSEYLHRVLVNHQKNSPRKGLITPYMRAILEPDLPTRDRLLRSFLIADDSVTNTWKKNRKSPLCEVFESPVFINAMDKLERYIDSHPREGGRMPHIFEQLALAQNEHSEEKWAAMA